jgi:hypothetical protein
LCQSPEKVTRNHLWLDVQIGIYVGPLRQMDGQFVTGLETLVVYLANARSS